MNAGILETLLSAGNNVPPWIAIVIALYFLWRILPRAIAPVIKLAHELEKTNEHMSDAIETGHAVRDRLKIVEEELPRKVIGEAVNQVRDTHAKVHEIHKHVLESKASGE